MKNILALLTPGDVHEYCRSLWRTPEFRDSHARKGYVYQWIDRFAEYPRLFGDLTEAEIEKAHFSPWWNVIGHRSYENPAINDLFYLHEIAHMSTMLYERSLTWKSWAAKMADNEMLASLESETLVYLELPSLREKSFPDAIWADRFLDGPSDPLVRAEHRSFMLMERYRARKVPSDDIEARISKFQLENQRWAEIWREHYAEVEAAMVSFRMGAANDARKAVAELRDWLQRRIDADGGVPFRREAVEFATVYWSTRRPQPTG